MKIFGSCHECQGPASTFPITADFQWVELDDMNDQGFAMGTCPVGHNVAVFVSSPTHVLLFDSACLALLRGFYREAIGSFAAALERFYEFGLRVLWHLDGVSSDEAETRWCKISTSSPRQREQFSRAYARRLGSPLPPWPHREFRNEVVHGGTFPRKQQAWEFGEASYGRIFSATQALNEASRETMQLLAIEQFRQRYETVQIKETGSLTTLASGISPVAIDRIWDRPVSFGQALQWLEVYPMWAHPADAISLKTIALAAGVSVHESIQVAKNGRLGRHLKRAIREHRAESRGARAVDRLLRQRLPRPARRR